MSLFDPEQYTVESRSLASVHAQDTYPLLRILRIEVNIPSPEYPLVEVELVHGAKILEPGMSLHTIETATEYLDDEEYSWDIQPYTGLHRIMRGFLSGIFTVEGASDGLLMRIDTDCTSVDDSRIGIYLPDIESVGVYPKRVAEVYAAYQNASVDGDTTWVKDGRQAGNVLTADELRPYVTALLPRPDIVYNLRDV